MSEPTTPIAPPPPPDGLPLGTARPKWTQRPIAVAGMVAAALVVGIGIGLAIPTGDGVASAEPTPSESTVLAFSKIIADCGDYADVEVVDDGNAIIIDGAGNDDPTGVDAKVIGCILTELETPQAVIARIDKTRALDGTQTGEWGEYSATWTYHPDDGLDLIIERS